MLYIGGMEAWTRGGAVEDFNEWVIHKSKNITLDNKQIEEIYNETFSGLTLFYRDTELADNLISKYRVGQIIMERGYTDMTYKGGGLTSNFRYLIASAFGKDLSTSNSKVAKFGLVVLSTNSYFKVLDIYKVEDKTQVFLLNIPHQYVGFFKRTTSNIEEDIVKKARTGFDNKANSTTILELQSKEWKERTEFPLGMSDNGEMFFDDSNLDYK